MNKKININFLIIVVLFGVWLLPLMQNKFQFVTLDKLGGISVDHEDTVLTFDSWFNGRYAEKKQIFLNDSFGFREIAIRFQDQIQYSLYKKANAQDVIVGKKNYLYELKYIKAFYGIDYIGSNKINEKVRKLKFIQDTLKKLNKTFIFLIAPTKASFYPEYIPDGYKVDSSKSNYEEFKPLLVKNGINYIDYNQMFINQKNTSKYPLYPVAGIHWTEYGTYIAMDSLTKFIEDHTDFILPKLDYTHNIKVTDAYMGADNDMGRALNLLIAPDYGKLAYPEVRYVEPKYIHKPKVLTVADSYWMRLYYTQIPRNLFEKHSFWYYYSISYDYDNETEGKTPSDLDLRKELMKQDVICIMSTETNLKSIGWRFVEDCYELFKNGKLDETERKRQIRIEKCRLNLWDQDVSFKGIKKIAKKEKKSIDSVALAMATYLVDTQK